MVIFKPRRGAWEETNTLTLNFQSPGSPYCEKINVRCVSTQSVVLCYGSPSRVNWPPSGFQLPGFKSWLWHLLTVETWASYFTSESPYDLSLFFLIDLYWRITASQYCVSFCCRTKWISHMHKYIPISPPFWASLPPSLYHPSRLSQSTELISLCYAAASH